MKVLGVEEERPFSSQSTVIAKQPCSSYWGAICISASDGSAGCSILCTKHHVANCSSHIDLSWDEVIQPMTEVDQIQLHATCCFNCLTYLATTKVIVWLFEYENQKPISIQKLTTRSTFVAFYVARCVWQFLATPCWRI